MTPFRAASLLALGLGLLTAQVTTAAPTPRPFYLAPPTPSTLLAGWAAPALVAPTVPATLEFANLKLDLTAGGRAAVQRLVDALYRHPAYLQQKIDRADTYFPIIDRVFREEGVPGELRYLALQESGLVSDAVSSSNAVGFWQFKKEAASDFNLKINATVDERRHVVESSRAAARYFKRSNAQLDNWVNSLLSYYTGLGGAKKLVSPADINARRMTITESTHPYVITFLAHKLAFADHCGQNPAPALRLEEVKARPGQTLTELAQSLNANPAEVAKYNKWLLGSVVPADKEYSVLVPVAGPAVLATAVATPVAELAFPAPTPEPNPHLPPPEITQINGLKAVVARKGDTPDILALVVGIDTKRFRYLNDLGEREGVVEGRPYYLQKKRNKAVAEYHVAQPGENVAQVSQQYGVKVKAVLRKNRMTTSDPLQPGRLLWLQHTRPADVPVEFVSTTPSTKPAPPLVLPGNGVAPAEAPTASTSLPPAPAATATVDMVTAAAPTPTTPEAPAAPAITASTSPDQAPAAVTLPPVAAPVATPPSAPAPAVAPAQAAPAAQTGQDTTRRIAAPAQTAPVVVAAAAPATPAATMHTVAKGETLSAISRQHGVTVKDLMAWNGLATPNLRLGQALRVSAPATGSAPVEMPPVTPAETDADGVTRHTVAAGESLYRIAKQYNTTVPQLMEWNSLTDFNVKLGQKLVVKK